MFPLEAVPNVSEGRDPAAIDAIAAAFSSSARLLDVHVDADHNRSVFTLAGDDEALVESLLAGVAKATEIVDLRRQDGVHPRVGAADVVPLVAVQPDDLDRATAAASTLGERIAGELGLPVFLYGAAGEGRRPADFRRGGPAELQRRIDRGELEPDYGPTRLHASAGAALVGSRRPLIAFNVDLATDDVEVAKEIASRIREANGGFPSVRALGLALPASGRVQVSMNLEDWETTPPHVVVARIEELAAERGVPVTGSELVGLIPAGAVSVAAAESLRLAVLHPERMLELRMLEGDRS